MRTGRTGRRERYRWFSVAMAVCLTVAVGWFPMLHTTDAAQSGTSGTNASASGQTETASQPAPAVQLPSIAKNKYQVKVTKAGKQYKKTVKAGKKIQISSVLCGFAEVKLAKCKFTSSKKSVATVSKKGVIKAKKKGKAVITVKYKKRKATLTLKVKAVQTASSTSAGTSSGGTASSSAASSGSSSGSKTTASSSSSSAGSSTSAGTAAASSSTAAASGSAKTIKGAPGKRTLKAYLQNALVPCGRTLYVYGGGWGQYGARIGYQSDWKKFFDANAGPDYNYENFQFEREKGVDCSGFAGWLIYNTLYSKNGQHEGMAVGSDVVASEYASNGWADLAKDSSDPTFKPGDVVSRGGHVWISMGQCSDGSVVIIHSTSPGGVQISGTKGKAADLAKRYMKTYFPKWPFTAIQMSSTYWKYKGRARWKVSGTGSVLSDPDGIQKMSAEQVLQLLLGK